MVSGGNSRYNHNIAMLVIKRGYFVTLFFLLQKQYKGSILRIMYNLKKGRNMNKKKSPSILTEVLLLVSLLILARLSFLIASGTIKFGGI